MAPAHGDGEAVTRAMGSSEENWTKATALGTGTAVVAIAFRRALEPHHVAQACRDVVAQHALLRALAVETAKGKLAFRVTHSAGPNIEICPWPPITAADDDLAAAVNAVTRAEINTPFVNGENATRPPLDLFQVHLYAEGSQTIVALRFHSGGLDRPSAYTVAQQFLTALSAVVDARPARLPHNPGTDTLLPPIEDLVPKGKSSKSFLQKGFDTVGYALSANKYALLPFQPGYGDQKKTPFSSDLVTFTLGKPGTASLLAKCKEETTTLPAALAAAFLKTATSTKELKDKKKDEFSFTSLVDCRRFFDPSLPADTVGNFVAGVPQGQQAKEGVAFWELARSVSASTERELAKSKQFSEIPVLNMLFAQVLKHPNVTPQSSMRTALFSLFVDEVPVGKWRDAEGLALESVSGPFPSMHGVGPCFAVSEVLVSGEDLSVTLIFPLPVFSRSQMEAFGASAMALLQVASQDS